MLVIWNPSAFATRRARCKSACRKPALAIATCPWPGGPFQPGPRRSSRCSAHNAVLWAAIYFVDCGCQRTSYACTSAALSAGPNLPSRPAVHGGVFRSPAVGAVKVVGGLIRASVSRSVSGRSRWRRLLPDELHLHGHGSITRAPRRATLESNVQLCATSETSSRRVRP